MTQRYARRFTFYRKVKLPAAAGGAAGNHGATDQRPKAVAIASQDGGLLNAAVFSSPDCYPVLCTGGIMAWHLGWQAGLVWLLAVALAGVIYFVPMTRFVDNLSDRVVAAAE
jgi:hypothetical protein